MSYYGDNYYNYPTDYEWTEANPTPFSPIKIPDSWKNPQEFAGEFGATENTPVSADIFGSLSKNWIWILAALAVVVWWVSSQKKQTG